MEKPSQEYIVLTPAQNRLPGRYSPYSDAILVELRTENNNFSVNLPDLRTVTNKTFMFKCFGSNQVIIYAKNRQKIDDVANGNIVITEGKFVSITSNGKDNWIVQDASISVPYYYLSDFESILTVISWAGNEKISLCVDVDCNIVGTLTIPDNIDIAEVVHGALFTGDGILNIGKMSCTAIWQIFDDYLTINFSQDAAPEYKDVWFGTVADGTTDDYNNLQRYFSSMPIGAVATLRSKAVYGIGDHRKSFTTTEGSDYINFDAFTKNITINGNQSVFKSTALTLAHQLLFDKVDDVRVCGLWFEGIETQASYISGGDYTVYAAMYFDSCKRPIVADCRSISMRSLLWYEKCTDGIVSECTNTGFWTSYDTNATTCPTMNIHRGSNNIVDKCKAYGAGSVCTAGGVTYRLRISNCEAEYCYDNGIYVSSGNECEVIGCSISNSYGTIKMRGSNNICCNNIIKDCYAGITLTCYNADLDSYGAAASGIKCHGNIICNIDTIGINGTGAYSKQARDITISNNTLINCHGTGSNYPISIGAIKGLTLCDNIIIGSSADYCILVGGLSTDYLDDVVIKGNYCENASAEGMRLQYIQNGVVSSNVLKTISGTYGIKCAYIKDCNIIDNCRDDRTKYILYTDSNSSGNMIATNLGLMNVYEYANRVIDWTTQSWLPHWKQIQIDYDELTTPGMSNEITLFTLLAASIIEGLEIYIATSFRGGSISAYTLSVGISGNATKYSCEAYDVYQSPSSSKWLKVETDGIESMGSNVAIKLTATSTGANLNEATQGKAYIRYKVSRAILWDDSNYNGI